MKAIIMAGGDGSRLRPATCTQPKPMVRVLDVPVLEYAIRLLTAHGVTDIAVTLRYLPDAIRDYFGDGASLGARIRWYEETAALGTAGGVKQAEDFLDERFLVLSGDGLTDCDLTALSRFHASKSAAVTLATVRAADPREYGVVCVDDEGRVTGFQEKPDWPDVICDRVNTGIYVMEPEVLRRVPAGRPCDFAKDVFPALLASGGAAYAWDGDFYWCDIGDTDALIRANEDALAGRISTIPTPADGRAIHPRARVDRGARLTPPVFIGESAEIAAGAELGPGCVVGAGCRVGDGASLKRCVLLPGAIVGERCQLRGCLVGEGARLSPEARMFEGSVIGAGCRIGRGAELASGVRVWPEKAIPDHLRLREHVIWGHAAQAAFHQGAVECLEPACAVRCAQALAASLKPKVVLAAHSGSAVAAAQYKAACAGLMVQGALIYDCRAATLMELRAMLRQVGADCACWLTAEAFYPLTRGGAGLTGGARRAFLSAMNRGGEAVPYAGITRQTQTAGRPDLIYLRSAVSDELIRKLSGFPAPVAVYARYEQLLSLAERAFLRAGLSVRAEWEEEMMELAPGEIGVWLSDTGEDMRLFTSEGELTETETQLLAAQTLLELGERRLILPEDATPAVEALAERYRARTERVSGGMAQWAARLAEAAPRQMAIRFDGISAALNALGMLHRLGMSLADFRRSAPASERRRRRIDVSPAERAAAMEYLNRELRPETPGRFHMEKGDAHAWILPAEEDGGWTVLAEAADAETAKELCDFYEKLVRGALDSSAGE